MGGGEEKRPSQAEKKRLAAEKLAAKKEALEAEKQKKAEAARPKLQHTPQWLSGLLDSFRSRAVVLEDVGDADMLVVRCHYHEQRLVQLIQQCENKTISAVGVEPIQEMLEYLLKLLSAEIVDSDELGTIDDDAIYDDMIICNAPSDATDVSDPQPTLQPLSPRGAIQALDLAESIGELRAAILQAEALAGHEGLLEALDKARGRCRNLELVESTSADAERLLSRSATHGQHSAARETMGKYEPPSDVQEPADGRPGRTVMNHSTHLPGLKVVMRRLEQSPIVKTIIPGKLSKGQAHAAELALRVQRDDDGDGEPSSGGASSAVEALAADKVKIVARTGYSTQDLALVLKPGLRLSMADVEQVLRDAVDPPRAEASGSYDALPGEGRLNLSYEEVRARKSQANHEKSKAEHERARAAQKAADKEKLIKEKAKKLAASGAAREAGVDSKAFVQTHAQKWAEVESGEAHAGKYWGGGRARHVTPSDS